MSVFFLRVIALAIAAWQEHACTISLSFDDTTVDHYLALKPILDANYLKATFFVNSGFINTADHMTLKQVRNLQSGGHEIGSHTVQHTWLKGASSCTLNQAICGDRKTLQSWGLTVSSFAYPYGAYDAATMMAVAGCGFTSARTTDWGSESIPTVQRYNMQAVAFDSSTTLESAQNEVLQCEAASNAWLHYYGHAITTSCGTNIYCTTTTLMQSFLSWLGPRASRGTAVQTIKQVIDASALTYFCPRVAADYSVDPSLQKELGLVVVASTEPVPIWLWVLLAVLPALTTGGGWLGGYWCGLRTTSKDTFDAMLEYTEEPLYPTTEGSIRAPTPSPLATI